MRAVCRLLCRKNGRHEASDGFAVNDGPSDLPGLVGNQSSPDGIALRPEIFAFVVEALGIAVHHDAQRDAINACADAAVVERCARIDGDHVRLGGIAQGVGMMIVDHVAQQYAAVVGGAADEKVVRGPFAAFVLPPGVTQPFAVGLKTAGREYAGFGGDAFAVAPCGLKDAVGYFQSLHRRFVADVYAEFFRTAIVGVDKCFAAAHEKGIGARYMQGAGERRLKMYTVATHPRAAGGGGANDDARQMFVGVAAGNFVEILPEFFFRVSVNQNILRRFMHAT